MASCDIEPMSRTYQYRKVMKPMLERKRRARINKCLDELKDLMVTALHTEGENINKLEKADVLELTVRHLRKLKTKGQLTIQAIPTHEEKFRDGFSHCASEVSRCLASIPGVDVRLGTKLMTHLGTSLTQFEKSAPLTILVPSSETSPALSSGSSGYSSASELSPTPSTSSNISANSSRPSSVNSTQQFHSTVTSRCSSVSPSYSQGLLAIVPSSQSVWRPW